MRRHSLQFVARSNRRVGVGFIALALLSFLLSPSPHLFAWPQSSPARAADPIGDELDSQFKDVVLSLDQRLELLDFFPSDAARKTWLGTYLELLEKDVDSPRALQDRLTLLKTAATGLAQLANDSAQLAQYGLSAESVAALKLLALDRGKNLQSSHVIRGTLSLSFLRDGAPIDSNSVQIVDANGKADFVARLQLEFATDRLPTSAVVFSATWSMGDGKTATIQFPGLAGVKDGTSWTADQVFSIDGAVLDAKGANVSFQIERKSNDPNAAPDWPLGDWANKPLTGGFRVARKTKTSESSDRGGNATARPDPNGVTPFDTLLHNLSTRPTSSIYKAAEAAAGQDDVKRNLLRAIIGLVEMPAGCIEKPVVQFAKPPPLAPTAESLNSVLKYKMTRAGIAVEDSFSNAKQGDGFITLQNNKAVAPGGPNFSVIVEIVVEGAGTNSPQYGGLILVSDTASNFRINAVPFAGLDALAKEVGDTWGRFKNPNIALICPDTGLTSAALTRLCASVNKQYVRVLPSLSYMSGKSPAWINGDVYKKFYFSVDPANYKLATQTFVEFGERYDAPKLK